MFNIKIILRCYLDWRANMSDISVFGDSVLKGVIYENNAYKVSKDRFSNICEDVL